MKSEDFIKHYMQKYDNQLPVWVATEIMQFGQLVRWMKVANYLRNVSAHHARLWKRRLTYKIGRIPDSASLLVHLNDDPDRKSRVYGMCAILAQLTSVTRPEDRWSARLVELLDTRSVDESCLIGRSSCSMTFGPSGTKTTQGFSGLESYARTGPTRVSMRRVGTASTGIFVRRLAE